LFFIQRFEKGEKREKEKRDITIILSRLRKKISLINVKNDNKK
jgi:hypothetical protein